MIGPILNAGGRLGKSNFATELLSSNDLTFINEKSIELIQLNEKRKEIESLILKEIDFNKIEKENEDIIVYFNQNINEGLIGIIAARLKDHFNKPSIVITSSNNLLKASARSTHPSGSYFAPGFVITSMSAIFAAGTLCNNDFISPPAMFEGLPSIIRFTFEFPLKLMLSSGSTSTPGT